MSNSTAAGSLIADAGNGGCGTSARPTRARKSSSAPSGSPGGTWAGSPQPNQRISLRAMQRLQPVERAVERPARRAPRHEAAELRQPAQLLLLFERHARARAAPAFEPDLGLRPLKDAFERRA